MQICLLLLLEIDTWKIKLTIQQSWVVKRIEATYEPFEGLTEYKLWALLLLLLSHSMYKDKLIEYVFNIFVWCKWCEADMGMYIK